MRKSLTLIFAMCSLAGICLAQEKPVPTRTILPEEIVQESIHAYRPSADTNWFIVQWNYTEAGAKKMLAFREAHEGQKIRTVVGSFETQPAEFIFRPMPPVFTNYTQWKEGWLKHRRSKIFAVSEADAQKIVTGLKISEDVS